MNEKTQITTWVLLVACGLILSACVQVRLLTYPSGFSFLESNSVTSVMHEMAIELNQVSGLINDTSELQDNSVQQAAIVSKLENVERLATSLSTGTSVNVPGEVPRPTTNHLLIDEHLDEFIDQTMRARQMAEATPANYFAAGQLIGNCNACHRMR